MKNTSGEIAILPTVVRGIAYRVEYDVLAGLLSGSSADLVIFGQLDVEDLSSVLERISSDFWGIKIGRPSVSSQIKPELLLSGAFLDKPSQRVYGSSSNPSVTEVFGFSATLNSLFVRALQGASTSYVLAFRVRYQIEFENSTREFNRHLSGILSPELRNTDDLPQHSI